MNFSSAISEYKKYDESLYIFAVSPGNHLEDFSSQLTIKKDLSLISNELMENVNEKIKLTIRDQGSFSIQAKLKIKNFNIFFDSCNVDTVFRMENESFLIFDVFMLFN